VRSRWRDGLYHIRKYDKPPAGGNRFDVALFAIKLKAEGAPDSAKERMVTASARPFVE
jgi:hypothetical protein